jgi:hypothetical protein
MSAVSNIGAILRSCAIVMLLTQLHGCVPVPVEPDPITTPLTQPGFFVVNEGLWRQDNATLSFVREDGRVETNVVQSRNKGLRLGDTGSDILVRGDSVFVIASTSRSIEVYHRRSGVWQARIRFDAAREPYRFARVNDTVAIVTMLNADAIAEINLRTCTIRVPSAPVGPAPEGVCVLNRVVYVANSGLGDLRRNEEGASTVSLHDISDLQRIGTIEGLPNVMHCVADAPRNRVWLLYRHYVSQPDSLGGVVLWDPVQKRIIQHVRFAMPRGLVVDPVDGRVYVLHRDGVDAYRAGTSELVRLRSHTSTMGNDIWYSLGWWPSQSSLLVGNARSYVTDGEVLVLDRNGNERFRVAVGLNPTAFGE